MAEKKNTVGTAFSSLIILALILAVGGAGSMVVAQAPSPVEVGLGAHEVVAGETVTIPIICTDLSGMGVIACELRLTYSGQLIIADGRADIGEVWSQRSSIYSRETIVDTTQDVRSLGIAVASASVAEGEGALCYVTFRTMKGALRAESPGVMDSDGGRTAPIEMTCLLNEGDPPVAVVAGTVRIVPPKKEPETK